jgi:transposase
MNVHENARMTVHGRLLLVQRVREAGWRVADAASAAGVSERTAYTWLARYRDGGAPALLDRSSAPAGSPCRLPAEAIAAIERLRRQRWTGPRIARALGRPVSTVGTVLRRLGLGCLSALEAKPPAIRYERSAAGELLHIDSKKLGRIDGLGHRVTGGRRGHRARGAGPPGPPGPGPFGTGSAGLPAADGSICMSRSTMPRASPQPSCCPTSGARPAPASSPALPPGSPASAFASSGS